MLDWMQEHRTIVWIAGASVALCVLISLAVAVVIVRLPAGYFENSNAQRPGGHAAWRIARNILGWFLIVAGVAMLVLPGPGGIVILLGVMLADFPGKRRLQRWIISRKGVIRSANWLRSKFGKAPLRVSPAAGEGGLKPAAAG